MQILLASNNRHKQRELRELLTPLGIELVDPERAGGLPAVEEDGETFAANAAKKAVAAARWSGEWSLADDSGLEVERLGGAPGVRSARFAGPACSDGDNNRLLLERLRDVPDGERGARFVCALALARPDGSLAAQVSGEARGRILHAPRGDGDFGYDPLFLFTEPDLPQTGRSFAELPRAEKSRVSHRGRALRELAKHLVRLRDARTAGPAPEPATDAPPDDSLGTSPAAPQNRAKR